MIPNYLVEGVKIDVSPLLNKDQKDEKKEIYYSQIQNLLPSGLLEIGMPMEGGKLILLQQGASYELIFYTSKGNYTCIGQVQERYKSNHLYMVTIELKSELIKLQRREYFRIDCTMEFEYAMLPQLNLSPEQNKVLMDACTKSTEYTGFHSGTVLDISGGGLRFISDHLLEQESFLRIHLQLEFDYGTDDMCLIGKVLLSDRLEDIPNRFENRVEFFHLNVEMRETIIRFIFNEERRARKQGKG